MLPADSICYSWFCRISSGGQHRRGRWRESHININAPMTIGLIISRGIYSSIRRRLAATNPRPIASKFSLERVEYRRTLLEKKKRRAEEKRNEKQWLKNIFSILSSTFDSIRKMQGWNFRAIQEDLEDWEEFFLDWQYSNERRKWTIGMRRGRIGEGRRRRDQRGKLALP